MLSKYLIQEEENALQNKIREFPKYLKTKNFICIGPTQNGKSTFINYFADGKYEKNAEIGGGHGNSCTTKIKKYKRNNCFSNFCVNFIDTIGIYDTNNALKNPLEFYKKLVGYLLQNKKEIDNKFIILYFHSAGNSSNSIEDIFDKFFKIFGIDPWKSSIVIVTKWDDFIKKKQDIFYNTIGDSFESKKLKYIIWDSSRDREENHIQIYKLLKTINKLKSFDFKAFIENFEKKINLEWLKNNELCYIDKYEIIYKKDQIEPIEYTKPISTDFFHEENQTKILAFQKNDSNKKVFNLKLIELSDEIDVDHNITYSLEEKVIEKQNIKDYNLTHNLNPKERQIEIESEIFFHKRQFFHSYINYSIEGKFSFKRYLHKKNNCFLENCKQIESNFIKKEDLILSEINKKLK